MSYIDTIKELCALPGVSGWEEPVTAYIIDRLDSQGFERAAAGTQPEQWTQNSYDIDPMGNLTVFKTGASAPGKRLMLAAHMDEVGLIVTDITDDGYLRFDFVGGVDRRVIIGKRVLVGDGAIPGVIGICPIHLTDKSAASDIPKLERLLIDIGVRDRESAAALVNLGDRAVFDGFVTEFGSGLLKAKAIDDRLGCAVLLELLASELPVDCYFAFTVQEEVGTRGATVAAYRVKPDVALVVEGTTAADLPGVETGKKICRLGEGAVVPFMDRGTVYDRGLYEFVTRLAERRDIPWQTKSVVAGGTDAGIIHRSGKGVRTIGIAAGIRNIHSPASIASINDMESVLELAFAFLEEYEDYTDGVLEG